MAEPRSPEDPFADRSARLAVFGGVAVVLGLGLILFALLYAALPFTGVLQESALPVKSVITGALTYLLLGAMFVCTGLGSILKRRWVRSVMLVLAWSWLLSGAIMLLFFGFLLDDVLSAASTPGATVPPEVQSTVKVVVLAAVALVGVLLPALFVAVYRDRALLETCRRANPEPGWTDRCPVPVLGLSLGLAAGALFALPMLASPVVPLFGKVVLGGPAAILTLLAVAVSGLLAVWTYRLERRGWWGSTLFLVLIGVSASVTFAYADPEELFAAIAQSGGKELGLSDSGPALLWATAIFTVLTLAYMVGIRRHFPFGRPDKRDRR